MLVPARWLSLTSTASERPTRWLVPPPARTAAFSSWRKPGVVLRVSSTSTDGLLSCAAATNCAVSVAMPERCPRKFSAVRSAVRMGRKRAGHLQQGGSGLERVAVLGPPLEREPGPEPAERRVGRRPAGQHAGLAGPQRVVRRGRVGHERRGHVAVGTEVLGQGAADRLVDGRRVRTGVVSR